ncbi:MAG: hypothetical protein ACK5KT_08875 [Dysgonomonas sp.]
MKKYILLVSIFCFASFQATANTIRTNIPQDSVSPSMDKLDLELEKLDIELEKLNINLADLDFDSSALSNLNVSFDLDSIKLLAMDKGFKASKEALSKLGNDVWFEFNNKRNSVKDNNDNETPTRVEKKNFSNISDIEFFHSYGNIVVKESTSKQVELEIQYFDTQSRRATCSVTTTGRLLTISTEKGSDVRKEGTNKSSNITVNLGSLSKNGKEKINYIISIPRSTSLNADLKYGNIKMDKFHGTFSANLSYSNLSAVGFTDKPQIKAKYSDIKIEDAKDIYLSGSYTDISIKKAGAVEVNGNYNDYKFGDIQSISTGNNSSYGDMKIGTVGNFQGNLKYADIVIETLVSNMDVTTAYGDIAIRNVSPSLKNINVKASYADVTITLPQNIGIAFDTNLSYGDLLISKRYDVKYTESTETGNRVVKKGQIGSKTPSATIKATNSYADIRIK